MMNSVPDSMTSVPAQTQTSLLSGKANCLTDSSIYQSCKSGNTHNSHNHHNSHNVTINLIVEPNNALDFVTELVSQDVLEYRGRKRRLRGGHYGGHHRRKRARFAQDDEDNSPRSECRLYVNHGGNEQSVCSPTFSVIEHFAVDLID